MTEKKIGGRQLQIVILNFVAKPVNQEQLGSDVGELGQRRDEESRGCSTLHHGVQYASGREWLNGVRDLN